MMSEPPFTEPKTTEPEELETFGDPGISSYNSPISKFLLMTYLLLPIWGIATLYYYWDGSIGWLDRGYWRQLQIAANTTNQETPNVEENGKNLNKID